MVMRLWGIGEGTPRAHGWCNSVMEHRRHGNEGTMAVGLWLWSNQKGVEMGTKQRGEHGSGNAVRVH